MQSPVFRTQLRLPPGILAFWHPDNAFATGFSSKIPHINASANQPAGILFCQRNDRLNSRNSQTPICFPRATKNVHGPRGAEHSLAHCASDASGWQLRVECQRGRFAQARNARSELAARE